MLIASLAVMAPLAASETVPAVCVQAEMPSPEAHSLFTPFTGRIKGQRVRLRAHPTLESFVVRETSPGEMFAIVGEEKEFYSVKPSRAMKGYVFRTFVLDNVVEGDRVNVRLAPDIDSPVIGQLHAGEKVRATVCDANNKWLEIALPSSMHFFVAREYVEQAGPIEMVAEMESKREQAYHLLSAAVLFAQVEMQKSFDEINLEQVHTKFLTLQKDFADFADITEKAKEADVAVEEAYIQKKIVFLESKADRTIALQNDDADAIQRLSKIGREVKGSVSKEESLSATSLGAGLTQGEVVPTDKMLAWRTFEESLYHVWAAERDGKTFEEFYQEEVANAVVVSGIIEPYNRPVKNRPGDFILQLEDRPIAFLYSTKVNLQDAVGKRVTLLAAPRPNNNFAFPAYFVLSVE